MIRPALLEDVPAIAEMGQQFHASAGWNDIGATYNIEDCARSLIHMIESEQGLLFVAEKDGELVGIAGGLMFPLYFNLSHQTGQEMFLYVAPEHRGRIGIKLLATLEDAARDAGCETWAMLCLEHVEPEMTGKLYQRRGYSRSEHTWVKRL